MSDISVDMCAFETDMINILGEGDPFLERAVRSDIRMLERMADPKVSDWRAYSSLKALDVCISNPKALAELMNDIPCNWREILRDEVLTREASLFFGLLMKVME